MLINLYDCDCKKSGTNLKPKVEVDRYTGDGRHGIVEKFTELLLRHSTKSSVVQGDLLAASPNR